MRTIHEKQTRQLCAVHTVNNLLQIPRYDFESGTKTDKEDDSNNEQNDGTVCRSWTCNGHVLQEAERTKSSSSDVWRAATQTEFDEIANEITLRERELLKSANNASSTQTTESLTLWQRLWSHHGTPLLGNYSLEVLQLALKRRGVDLDYFHVPEQNTEPALDNNGTKPIHIGFVIYQQGHSYTSYLKRIGGYIPVIKHFCKGKHWYAITRVQYNSKPTCDIDSPQVEKTVEPSWCLIDSKLDELTVVNSNEALMALLREVQNMGGLVFRATCSTQD